jgi:ribosomal protein L20A (L18A)
MRIYKFSGLANQIHAIGEREKFEMYIRAENRDEAIARLYSKW